MQIIDVAPWLCWIFPIIGALAALALNKVNRKAMNITVLVDDSAKLDYDASLIPDLFNYSTIRQFAVLVFHSRCPSRRWFTNRHP